MSKRGAVLAVEVSAAQTLQEDSVFSSSLPRSYSTLLCKTAAPVLKVKAGNRIDSKSK